MSKAASSPGRPSRPTIRAPGPTCPTTSRAVARAGASYSWYLYSGNRVKYPLVRARLLKLWREARATPRRSPPGHASSRTLRSAPVLHLAGAASAASSAPAGTRSTRSSPPPTPIRSKNYGPDRIIGFSPIPAMSMVSYAAGARYLSLLGGVCLSFYDWYCDLPPASPQTWGEQTDVPESADWYNAGFLILWGSNVPQTRTPDAHFYTEVRYKGAKSVVISPGLFRGLQIRRSLAASQAGHGCGAGDGDGPCHPARIPYRPAGRLFPRLRPAIYRHADAGAAGEAGRHAMCPNACCAPTTSPARWAKPTIRNGRPRLRRGSAAAGRPATALSVSAGAKKASGTWRRRRRRRRRKLRLSLADDDDAIAEVGFPYFGNARTIISRAPTIPTCSCATSRSDAAAERRRDAGRHGVRSAAAPITASIAASAAPTSRRLRRQDDPTRPPGPKKSPACRARTIIHVAREFATTPRRPTAARWSSSAPG